MIKDPLTAWPGPFPYDVLGEVGITPDSSHAEVGDASFVLMTRRLMNPVTQKAWDELRDVRRRLLADALLYDVDLGEEVRRARARLARELAEPDEPPEVAAALAVSIELLDGLGGDPTAVALAPPPPLDLPDDLGVGPAESVIANLIQFDR